MIPLTQSTEGSEIEITKGSVTRMIRLMQSAKGSAKESFKGSVAKIPLAQSTKGSGEESGEESSKESATTMSPPTQRA